MKSQQPSVPKQKRTQISKNHPKSKHSQKAHGNFTGTLRLSLENHGLGCRLIGLKTLSTMVSALLRSVNIMDMYICINIYMYYMMVKICKYHMYLSAYLPTFTWNVEVYISTVYMHKSACQRMSIHINIIQYCIDLYTLMLNKTLDLTCRWSPAPRPWSQYPTLY